MIEAKVPLCLAASKFFSDFCSVEEWRQTNRDLKERKQAALQKHVHINLFNKNTQQKLATHLRGCIGWSL